MGLGQMDRNRLWAFTRITRVSTSLTSDPVAVPALSPASARRDPPGFQKNARMRVFGLGRPSTSSFGRPPFPAFRTTPQDSSWASRLRWWRGGAARAGISLLHSRLEAPPEPTRLGSQRPNRRPAQSYSRHTDAMWSPS